MNLALFDFDGTITRTDTWTGFVRASATRPRLVIASVLLSPLILAYKLRLIPARRARPIVAIAAFAGRRAETVEALGRRYAREVLPGVIRRRARERIAWHQQRGDRVVVVSASLAPYVTAWCETVGVEAICTELEVARGRLTGRLVDGECCGAEKTRRIRARYALEAYPVIYAYGDTDEDREMLALAHEKSYRWTTVTDLSSLSPDHPRASSA